MALMSSIRGRTSGEVNLEIKTVQKSRGAFLGNISPGSNGTFPVAILSSEQFDATRVNPASVRVGGATVQLKGKNGLMFSIEDVKKVTVPNSPMFDPSAVTATLHIRPGPL